jgi:hypothetical protein
MRVAAVLVMLTVASPAFADGAIVKSCDWSAAGSCPFDATKGDDYLIDVVVGTDCEATIQLVNPAGQVTKSLSVEQLTDFCDGSTGGVEFRAASTGTFHLRYVPSGSATPGPGAAHAIVVTDCRADAKTHCSLSVGARPVANERTTNGDTDWLKLADLRRGRLYTVTATGVDRYTKFLVLDATGAHVVARGQVHTGSTTGSVRLRPPANGTYFLVIPNGHHRTLSLR